MAEVSLPIEGGCQCGALRYQLTAPPLMIYACHCTNCQKQTGSAFVLSATVGEGGFQFTIGEPARYEWKSDAGNDRYGYFCETCGNRIANGQTPTIGVLSLRAGTIDDASWVKPSGHIWLKSAQSWFKPHPDDIVCNQQPTDYAPFVARFQSFGLFGPADDGGE